MCILKKRTTPLLNQFCFSQAIGLEKVPNSQWLPLAFHLPHSFCSTIFVLKAILPIAVFFFQGCILLYVSLISVSYVVINSSPYYCSMHKTWLWRTFPTRYFHGGCTFTQSRVQHSELLVSLVIRLTWIKGSNCATDNLYCLNGTLSAPHRG